MTRTTGTLLAILLVVFAGGAIYYVARPDNSDSISSPETSLTTETTTEPEGSLAPTEPLIRDTETISTDILPRTVVERVEYNLPRAHTGTLSVNVEVDEQGVVASLTYEHQDVEPVSAPHHASFDAGFDEAEFVGVPLDDIDDVFIAGASLTSGAFNTALNNLQSRL